MTKRLALGKGLGALISDADDIKREAITLPQRQEPERSAASIFEIPIDKIETNPFQPRTTFDEDALSELAESIKLLGLIQPITVRNIGNKYQIISGERRFRASQIAGLTKIPAYVRSADDQGMLEMAIVENIQRQDLDSIEIALSFQRLIEECSLTQEAMAERVGKKRATVTNYLRLLKLPAEIQAALRNGSITMGHAKGILSLDNPELQRKLCDTIINKDLSVRQVEEKVRQMAKGEKFSEHRPEPSELPESHYRMLEIVGRFFNNNISLKRSETGKGSITIQFSNDAEVESFLNAIEHINKIQ